MKIKQKIVRAIGKETREIYLNHSHYENALAEVLPIIESSNSTQKLGYDAQAASNW